MKMLLLLLCVAKVGLPQDSTLYKKNWQHPADTEQWEPLPVVVTPAPIGGQAPSDAIILFDGSSLDKWIMADDSSQCKWILDKQEKSLTVNIHSGDIKTNLVFGSCQLHIEFRLPQNIKETRQHYDIGNSGIFLQERYEVQIFDSYQNETSIYANGQCGSIYKQAIPLVNACAKPGAWECFDIYYTAPQFRSNGTVSTPAFITVVHNGILIINHFEIQGGVEWIGIPNYQPHGQLPLLLQAHGSAVSFRNIWIRNL